MPTLTIHYQTEAQRLAYERAIAFVAEWQQAGLDGPAEAVVASCEGLALEKGRQLLRDSLAAAIQGRVDRFEEKGATRRTSAAATPGSTRADASGRCGPPAARSRCGGPIASARPAARAGSPPMSGSASDASSPPGPAAWPAPSA